MMNKTNQPLRKITNGLRLMIVLVCLISPMATDQHFASASTTLGPIAYIRPNYLTGDEIHLIEADGTNDRILWETGVSRPETLVDIKQLAWKPDARELAFSSSHEANCSLYENDIYAVRSDGQEYRRVSGPPACGNPDGLPTGTVRVPVVNLTYDESGPFTIYFEGAPGPIEIALAPGQEIMLTFNNVVDFGGQLQYAVAMFGEVRSFDPDAKADVLPGATLETGELAIGGGLTHYGFQWPTYNPDGSKIGSMLHKDELYQVSADNRVPGLEGERLRILPTMSNDYLLWGPTAVRANQFLYEGWVDCDTIFLGDASTGTSQLILTIDPLLIGQTLLGLAWLPDGSGFLYSYSELAGYVYKADLFAYSLATGQSTRLTELTSGFIRRMTTSPDGQYIVFEYQASGDWYDTNPAIDLYIADLETGEVALLVENGQAPVWSPAVLPEPIVYTYVFMPFVRKH